MSFLKKIITKLEQKKNKNLNLLQTSDLINTEDAAKKIIHEGNQFEDAGNLDIAINFYERAISIAPNYIGGYLNKGNIFFTQNEFDLAIKCYLKAIAVAPSHAGAYLNLGNAYYEKKQFEFSLAAYEKAISLNEKYFDAWVGRGNSFNDLGNSVLAIESYKQAIQLNPEHPEIYKSIGLAYQWIGYLKEAEESIQEGIKLRPNRVDLYYDLCNIYREMGDVSNAISTARKGCAIDPNHMSIHSLLLFSLSHSSDISRNILFEEHLNFGKKFRFYFGNNRPFFLNEKNETKILKVGIISADLRNHAVANFFEPVYDHLINEPSVDLFIYDNIGANDDAAKRMRGKIQAWKFVANKNDTELENEIKRDEIDILIDLSGHSAGHRLLLFTRKPAPIQMSWIGYPGTTGVAEIDYYIGDRHYLPPGRFDDIFIEKILRLPATTPFTPYVNAPDVNDLPALRNKHFTFGSFNRLDKLSEDVIELWSKLILAVSNSKMILGAMPATGNFDKLLGWFSKYGVSSDRLVFHRRTDMRTYLSLHHEVDLCLDAFPYGASTTSCHAIFMGVPTITLLGETPASASGQAFLSQLNLTDLFVATTHDEYVKKAIWCTEHLSELAELRSNLRQRFIQSNVMNPELITNALLVGMRYAWKRWCNNLPPESFEVIPSNINSFTISSQ